MSKKKFKTISWEDLQSMGNPELAGETQEEVPEEMPATDEPIRIYLEKKGRRGKSVTIIKGLSLSDDAITALAKELKVACGVGGTVDSEEIILQGDKRLKAQEMLRFKGYTDVKIAGN